MTKSRYVKVFRPNKLQLSANFNASL